MHAIFGSILIQGVYVTSFSNISYYISKYSPKAMLCGPHET